MTTVFGLGFRAGIDIARIEEGFRLAVQAWGPPSRLAYPFFRADYAAPLEALMRDIVDLMQVDAASLKAVQNQCLTHSERARAAVGFSSVAEGCALAAAKPGAHLVAPRRVYAGVTIACALNIRAPQTSGRTQ